METQEKPGVDGAEPGGHGHSLGTPGPRSWKEAAGTVLHRFWGGEHEPVHTLISDSWPPAV